jgi:hypothetical protein
MAKIITIYQQYAQNNAIQVASYKSKQKEWYKRATSPTVNDSSAISTN